MKVKIKKFWLFSAAIFFSLAGGVLLFFAGVKTKSPNCFGDSKCICPSKKIDSREFFADSNQEDYFGYYPENDSQIYLLGNFKQNKIFISNNEIVSHLKYFKKNLVSGKNYKSNLKISPDNSKIGYLNDLDCFSDAQNIKTDCENFISLRIANVDGSNNQEIYRGDYMHDWEWITDKEIALYHSCGTACIAVIIIDSKTGEEKSKFCYGTGYVWAPNKKYVLAYTYSGEFGITVGDKKGNESLFVNRNLIDHNDLIEKTKAVWSLNSRKLALIIKKEEEDKMELLVFSAEDNFKKIFQEELKSAKEYFLNWVNDNKLYCNEIELNLL